VRRLVAVVLVSSIILCGCRAIFTQKSTSPSTINEVVASNQDFPSEVVEDVAKLPLLDISSVENYQQFTDFADAVNVLVKLLNKESNGTFSIPLIDISFTEYQNMSRVITKYSPLIGNYNDVVESAKQVHNGKSDKKEFYKASAILGLEVAVIFSGIFYQISYDSVGVVYRAVGLNRFAFEYPSCVSFILSEAHWAIRTALVEESSKIANTFLDAIQSTYNFLSSDPIKKATDYIKSHISNK
jgi:hypothetical protein